MKKIGIVVFVIALVAGIAIANMFSFGRTATRFSTFSVSFGGVHGSGNVTADKRGVAGFDAVEVSGVFQVEITAQKDFAVEVNADDNLLPMIKTEVDGGVLKISSDRKLSASGPIRVRVFAPNIDKLDVSGVANVTVSDLSNTEFTLGTSGASKVKLSGETSKLTIDVSGATKIDAEDLKAVDANIDASGASNVVVSVSGDLRTEATGASKVIYAGTPASIEQTTHGASRVSQK